MAKTKKVVNIKEYKKVKKNSNKRIVILFISTLFLIIVNISGYTIINDLNNEVIILKKELKEEEIRLDQAQAKEASQMSVEEIEKIAKEELNMDFPSKDQIRYINTTK